MDREGHKDVKFFVGTEVDEEIVIAPSLIGAYGQKTLFVVGI